MTLEQAKLLKPGDYILTVGAGTHPRKLINVRNKGVLLQWDEPGDIPKGWSHSWRYEKIERAIPTEDTFIIAAGLELLPIF